MNAQQLEQFWSGKDYKIYVVRLSCSAGRRMPENRYVRIPAEKNTELARHRAVKCAVANSIDFANGKRLSYSVRLAHPVSDLGCVESKPVKLRSVA